MAIVKNNWAVQQNIDLLGEGTMTIGKNNCDVQ